MDLVYASFASRFAGVLPLPFLRRQSVSLSMTRLSLRQICKSYLPHQPVLQELNLEVAPGEWLVLLGASGSGKSTLLQILAGLLPADRGSVCMDGEEVLALPSQQRSIGYVFQMHGYYEQLTVRQNLEASLSGQRMSRGETVERVQWIADLLGISRFLDRKPEQLSGGQLQRLSLGRGLVRRPKLLLLDEPFNHLDESLRRRLQDEMRELHQQLGMTTLYVTHDVHEGLRLADRIAVLHQGSIAQVDSPDRLYDFPSSRRVAEAMFSRDLHWIEGWVQANRDGWQLGCQETIFGTTRHAHPQWSNFLTTAKISSPPMEASDRVRCWLGLRLSAWQVADQPHPLQPSGDCPQASDIRHGLPATIVQRQFAGDGWRLRLKLTSHVTIEANASRPQGDLWRVGDTCCVTLQADQVLVFPWVG